MNGKINDKEKESTAAPLCSEKHIHEHVERHVIESPQLLQDLADLFKVFGDPTRIRILYALSGQELCVCDIADVLDMTQSAISHQLRVLKQSRLVKFRRDGKTVFYSLSDNHVYTILRQGMDHVLE